MANVEIKNDQPAERFRGWFCPAGGRKEPGPRLFPWQIFVDKRLSILNDAAGRGAVGKKSLRDVNKRQSLRKSRNSR